MLTFVLAMVLYPDVQARAQAEIDAVVGDGRLPELKDRESLPYINCMIKELLRWHLVLPMSKFPEKQCQEWVNLSKARPVSCFYEG